jgi:menin
LIFFSNPNRTQNQEKEIKCKIKNFSKKQIKIMDRTLIELFPLDSPEKVINLFTNQLESTEPNLTLISIVLGFFENLLTSCNRENRENKFPSLDYQACDELYKKFKSIVSIAETGIQAGTQQKSKKIVVESNEPKVSTREKIKKISDVIWNSLLRSSYKDRIHLQSVYSYLTGNKLDSFGVALVTVAACQLLNYKDVKLALGEDHVWIVFGNTGESYER